MREGEVRRSTQSCPRELFTLNCRLDDIVQNNEHFTVKSARDRIVDWICPCVLEARRELNDSPKRLIEYSGLRPKLLFQSALLRILGLRSLSRSCLDHNRCAPLLCATEARHTLGMDKQAMSKSQNSPGDGRITTAIPVPHVKILLRRAGTYSRAYRLSISSFRTYRHIFLRCREEATAPFLTSRFVSPSVVLCHRKTTFVMRSLPLEQQRCCCRPSVLLFSD